MVENQERVAAVDGELVEISHQLSSFKDLRRQVFVRDFHWVVSYFWIEWPRKSFCWWFGDYEAPFSWPSWEIDWLMSPKTGQAQKGSEHCIRCILWCVSGRHRTMWLRLYALSSRAAYWSGPFHSFGHNHCSGELFNTVFMSLCSEIT